MPGDIYDLEILLRARAEGMAAFQEAQGGLSGLAKAGLVTGGILAVGLVAGAVAATKAAADFETKITQLRTGAGETEGNIRGVSDGLLAMAGQVGDSATELASAMYTIESSGVHGAAGLEILRASAEGAKAGAADLGTVTNALTSVMASYHAKSSDAVKIMDELVQTEASGKLHMDDLAGSLSAVVPLASSLNISFAQVGGAIATMTNHGESAQEASQNLANTIRSLAAPNDVASKAMAQMGLSATDVSQHLGDRGLTGTLDILTNAILAHMGPSGLVLQNTFNASKQAASDARKELANLPPTLQKSAQAYYDGTITQKQWTAVLATQPASVRNLAREFATTTNNAHGFNSALRSGTPDAKTFQAVMEQMTGGATGLNTALMLGGENAPVFKKNVEDIGKAAQGAGKDVEGWSLVQKTFNQQWGEFSGAAGSAAIVIGQQLLPVASELMQWATPMITKSLPGLTQGASDVAGALKDVAPAIGWVSNNMGIIAPVLGTIVGFWVAWNVGLAITQGIGIVVMAAQFVDGLVAILGAIGPVTAAQWALNVAMDANPIGVVIIAIAALVAIGYLLVTHWKELTGWANSLHDKFPWLADAMQALTGPIGEIIGLAGSITNHWQDVVNIFDAVGGAVKGAISWMDKLPGGGNSSPSTLSLTRAGRASGGPVSLNTPYLVGEQGPELFIPQSSGTVIPADQTASMRGGDTHISVHVQSNADPFQIASEVSWELRKARRY